MALTLWLLLMTKLEQKRLPLLGTEDVLSLHSCYSIDSCLLCLVRDTLPYAFLGYSIGKQKKKKSKKMWGEKGQGHF